MAEVIELPRKPGRPKGSRNRVKKQVAQVFDPVARRMTRKLEKRFDEELAKGSDCNLDFCQKLYTTACSYAWGQPVKRNEISGPEGGPQVIEQHRFEAAQRVAEVFSSAAEQEDPAEAMTDEGLRGLQAISFLKAQKEAAQRQTVGAHDVIRDSVKTSTATETAPSESTPPKLRQEESGVVHASGTAARQSADIKQAPVPGCCATDKAATPVAAAAAPVQPTPPEPKLEPPDEGEILSFLENGWSIHATPANRPGLPTVYAAHKDNEFIRNGSFESLVKFIEGKVGGPHGPWMTQRPKQQAQEVRPDQRSGDRTFPK